MGPFDIGRVCCTSAALWCFRSSNCFRLLQVVTKLRHTEKNVKLYFTNFRRFLFVCILQGKCISSTKCYCKILIYFLWYFSFFSVSRFQKPVGHSYTVTNLCLAECWWSGSAGWKVDCWKDDSWLVGCFLRLPAPTSQFDSNYSTVQLVGSLANTFWHCTLLAWLVIVRGGRGSCWTSTDVDVKSVERVESALAAGRYQSFCSSCCKWCVIFIGWKECICCLRDMKKENYYYPAYNYSLSFNILTMLYYNRET